MSGLSSCNSWKDLKKPDNPFYGAMFSRSHRKRKRKRVLQPIDNPNERGRSLENKKDNNLTSAIRSISVENSAVMKIKHDISKLSMLDPNCQTIVSTESSVELKLPPKPSKIPKKKINVPKPLVFEEDSLENEYAGIDQAISNNAINMRNKFLKPAHPNNPKPQGVLQRGRKFIKSPTHLNSLQYAPDLKPVGINSFQIGLACMEYEYTQYFNCMHEGRRVDVEELVKNINCKICLN